MYLFTFAFVNRNGRARVFKKKFFVFSIVQKIFDFVRSQNNRSFSIYFVSFSSFVMKNRSLKKIIHSEKTVSLVKKNRCFKSVFEKIVFFKMFHKIFSFYNMTNNSSFMIDQDLPNDCISFVLVFVLLALKKR